MTADIGYRQHDSPDDIFVGDRVYVGVSVRVAFDLVVVAVGHFGDPDHSMGDRHLGVASGGRDDAAVLDRCRPLVADDLTGSAALRAGLLRRWALRFFEKTAAVGTGVAAPRRHTHAVVNPSLAISSDSVSRSYCPGAVASAGSTGA
jgi:hypothetical protein